MVQMLLLSPGNSVCVSFTIFTAVISNCSHFRKRILREFMYEKRYSSWHKCFLIVYRLLASVLDSGIYFGTKKCRCKKMSLVMLFVLNLPYRSTRLELTKLDLGHSGCDLNKRSRRDSLPAVAFAGKYVREVKAAHMRTLQAVIY